MSKSFIFVVLMLFFACQKQSVEPTVYSIDKDLESYIKTFVDEAKIRGVEVKVENLIMKFGVTSDEICGQCTFAKGNGQRTVTINNDLICW